MAVRNNFDIMIDFRSSIERNEKNSYQKAVKEMISSLKDEYLLKIIHGRAHKHLPAFSSFETDFLDWPKWLSEKKMEEHFYCLDREDANMQQNLTVELQKTKGGSNSEKNSYL